MTTIQPYNWIKQIPLSVLQKDEVPLVGFIPPFPWDTLSQSLQKTLGLSSLTITANKIPEWKEAKDLFAGLGKKPVIVPFVIAPENGLGYWVMSEQDVGLLMANLLQEGEVFPLDSIDPDYRDGFYHFLALETIYSMSQIDFWKNLSIQIVHSELFPEETCLCLDVSIAMDTQTCWGRIILSNNLYHQWKERFAERSLDIPVASKLELTFHLEAGRTSMSMKQWSNVKLGDFLLLDSCSITPSGEGNVSLTVEGVPLFQGKLENGNINILDYSVVHEENTTMTKNPEDSQEENKENEDFEFLNNEEEEVLNEENENENEEELDIDEEEEIELDEDLLSEEDLERKKWPPPPEKAPAAEPEHIHVEKAAEEEQPFSPGQIPLTIVVEIGRIQMAIQKLIELQPGNILDLNVHPENGVDLVINGKRVGKGELLQIGETLGVRILDIG